MIHQKVQRFSHLENEGFGLEYQELHMHGKPFVSTDINQSVTPTLNNVGVTGYRVPINDSISFAEKINLLVNNFNTIDKYINYFTKILGSDVKEYE